MVTDCPALREVYRFAAERWACSSRARLKSATITTAAPSKNAADAAASPTGPAPEMSTLEPVVTPALTHRDSRSAKYR